MHIKNHNKISTQSCQSDYYPKKQQIASVAKNVKKRDVLCTVGGNVNWYSHYGKQYGDT